MSKKILSFIMVLCLIFSAAIGANAYTQTFYVDNDALATSGGSNFHYPYHFPEYLSGSNHYNSDARLHDSWLNLDAAYMWNYNNSIAGPSNVDSTTVQVYLNDSRFNDDSALYEFSWTNNIGGTTTLEAVYNQDSAPAGWSNVFYDKSTYMASAPSLCVTTRCNDYGIGTGADGVRFIVEYA